MAYMKRSRRYKNGCTYDSWSIVESVWTAKGPRQRTIATMGRRRSMTLRSGWAGMSCRPAVRSGAEGTRPLVRNDAEDACLSPCGSSTGACRAPAPIRRCSSGFNALEAVAPGYFFGAALSGGRACATASAQPAPAEPGQNH